MRTDTDALAVKIELLRKRAEKAENALKKIRRYTGLMDRIAEEVLIAALAAKPEETP